MKRSKTLVKVKGLNQERGLNKVIKEIKIYNFSRKQHGESEFEVDYNKYSILKKKLEEEGLEVEIVSHKGFGAFLKKFLSCYGTIVALIVCILFYSLQYSLILKVEVFGIENAQEINTFVEKSLNSRFKNKIDTKKMEVLIKDNFEEISSVSIAIVGQTLVININEAILPEEMKEGQGIFSKYDGLITDINLIQGTLAVDIGDIVREGDILVYPYIIDSQGEKKDVNAKAEIWADVWLKETETFYDYYISTERTGRKSVLNEIYIGGLLLYSNGANPKFEQYEKEVKSCEISKNNILPLSRRSIIYYETVTKEIKQSFEECKDEVIEKARKKTLIFLRENEIIKEENFTLREGGGLHNIDYVITVNRNLGG